MRFDTIIIGGGLAGLVCGLKLQKAGKNCAVVSAGQNAMHFFSGGFGLLSRMPDGTPVETPLTAIPSLPAEHPYSKIGAEKIGKYAEECKTLLNEAGLTLTGDASKNRYVVTATGTLKPAWLVSDDIASVSGTNEAICKKALIVNIEGFLDFNTSFIAKSLENKGATCRITAVTTDEIKHLRRNPTEMRATNIARLMEKPEVLATFISKVNAAVSDEHTVVLPAVFGLKNEAVVKEVKEKVNAKVLFLGTLPPSVTGIRYQQLLKEAFEAAGGVFLMGDQAVSARFDGNKVVAVSTANMGDIELTGDNYILASGSYFGHGLIADIEKIIEPVFGADVLFDADRNSWYDKDFFARQNYIGFGVATDGSFKVMKDGAAVENLFAAGSILGGYNPLYEGCGAGVALMTAFSVTDSILGR